MSKSDVFHLGLTKNDLQGATLAIVPGDPERVEKIAAIQLGAPAGEFAVGGQLDRLIHQRGDLFHSLWIARDDGQGSPL